MAITNSMENFEMIVNDAFIKKADALIPELIKTEVTPERIVTIEPDGDNYKAVFNLYRYFTKFDAYVSRCIRWASR